MTSRITNLSRFCTIGLTLSVLASPALAQQPRDRNQLPEPVYKVERLDNGSNAADLLVAPLQPGEHPLVPTLKWAQEGYTRMQRDIQDYSATLIKRERIGGTLSENEYMFVKIRQKPFSAYTYFLGPDRLKGQEAIYVEGKNDNKIVGHGVGIRKIAGTVHLDPTSYLAMQGNRYPITQIGLMNLTGRLIEIGTADTKYGECDVKTIKGAKINGRTCTAIEVIHPVPRKNFLFHKARIFVDDEMQLITRYEAYDWPAEVGGQPQLTEEYTYLNLKVNNGFTDMDFDPANPQYGYR